MPALPSPALITANGTYTVSTFAGKKYTFAAAGNFGGGTLAILWRDAAGNTGTYAQSPATAAENWTATAATVQVDLVLTGATSPAITITFAPAEGRGVEEGTLNTTGGIALGGTGASTAAGARANLEVRFTDLAPFNLVIAGDSIFGLPGFESALLPKSYFVGSGRTTAFNTAVGGENTAQFIARYAAHVFPRRPAANSGKRAVLLVLVGTNDAIDDATQATNVTNLLAYVATAKTDGFEVWVCTRMPRGDANGLQNHWDGFNRRLKASNIPDKIIDLNAILRDATDTSLLYDWLHPTGVGYELIANAINTVAWSDQKTGVPNYGTMAKQNADSVNITGGKATFNQITKITHPGSAGVVISGANNVSVSLQPDGGTGTDFIANSGAGTYGIQHYTGTVFVNPLSFAQGASMAATFGGGVTTNGLTNIIHAGEDSLKLSGNNRLSIALSPPGGLSTHLFADVAMGLYGLSHWTGSNMINPLSFAQGTSMTATFGGRVINSERVRLKTYTVAALVALTTPVAGDTATVTDATAPTWGGTLTGGGAVTCNALYNGTAWVAG